MFTIALDCVTSFDDERLSKADKEPVALATINRYVETSAKLIKKWIVRVS